MDTLWKVLTRKKVLDPVTSEESQLGRVLNTFDLTALGVGSTLGVGVYVLAGQVAKETAGPAVVLSFLIATVASVFAGLCYAEFGARAPRAGSAYIYSYVCVGEFVAFVIGWNLILEYVIGSASVARGLSLYFDTLINGTLQKTFIDIAPLGHVDFISAYFDFFAFGVSLLLAMALAFGLKESSWVNNIFTMLNLGVVFFVIVAGGINSKTENWRLQGNSSDPAVGDGGFFPFGAEGVIKGAATCFYGFVGFDCIATTGEEVKNPKKAIPFAIVLSLGIIFLSYFGTSTVITLMVPYYAQDANAPLPHAFESVGWDWAKWIVAIGGIFGLCASLFGAMFPLPRIIYAMASDNLVFRSLGRVSERFKTPVVGTILAGCLTGLMAAVFELKQLVNMMSIGTLLAYTIVATSVLLLRYEVDKGDVYQPLRASFDLASSDMYTESRVFDGDTSDEDDLMSGAASSGVLTQLFNCGRQKFPTKLSEKIVKIEVCLYCVLCIFIGLCAKYLKVPISKGEIWAIVITAVIVCVTILVIMSVTTQPKSRKELSFKVPLVPLIPALSILINIYLMLMLDPNTWIRFGVWMAIGIPIYYFSVQTHPDARNASVSTRLGSPYKQNGHTNNGFSSDLNDTPPTPKKKLAPPPPTLRKIEATIADLDQMLENEEANIDNDRKFSSDSLSIASNVLWEEDVQADVHCSDVTPRELSTQISTVSDAPISVESVVEQFSVGTPELSPQISVVSESRDRVDSPELSSRSSVVSHSLPEYVSVDETPIPPVPPPPPQEPFLQPLAIVPPPPPFIEELVIPRPTLDLTGIDQVKLKRVREHSEITDDRMKFLNHIGDVKLKHVPPKPETPAADYSRQNSEVPKDDNVKFGSQQYKEFKEQLDQVLQQGYIPTQIVVDLKKTPSISSNVHPPNQDVIEDNINTEDAKIKLQQFLEESQNSSLYGQEFVRPNHVERHFVVKETDEKEDRDHHRRNMQNILGSIKLRKEDSFKADDKGSEPPNETSGAKEVGKDDQVMHRQNMDGVFKSIRLRKTDSFKGSESQ